jgi:hypothetical protein
MVSINIIIERHSKNMYACEKNFKALKMDGICQGFYWMFDMYVKHGSKKIWYEMIVRDSKSYIKMSKYNIVSNFLRCGFGHVSILM